MWRIRSLLLAGLALLAALPGCTIGVGNPGRSTCDRNGDQEQRIACRP